MLADRNTMQLVAIKVGLYLSMCFLVGMCAYWTGHDGTHSYCGTVRDDGSHHSRLINVYSNTCDDHRYYNLLYGCFFIFIYLFIYYIVIFYTLRGWVMRGIKQQDIRCHHPISIDCFFFFFFFFKGHNNGGPYHMINNWVVYLSYSCIAKFVLSVGKNPIHQDVHYWHKWTWAADKGEATRACATQGSDSKLCLFVSELICYDHDFTNHQSESFCFYK